MMKRHVVCFDCKMARQKQRLKEAKQSPRINTAVREHRDFRLHEQLNLETLAAVAGVGVWTFTRHFRESLGRTPHANVIERRIDRARPA